MNPTLTFTKAQALGNDFVIIDDRTGQISLSSAEISYICDRHRGVGADGILLLQPSATAAFRMRTLNSDGTEAEMCGNGIRCAAKYAFDQGLAHLPEMMIETKAGLKKVEIITEKEGVAQTIRVDLGAPNFERAAVPMAGAAGEVVLESFDVNGSTLNITALSMGNPHVVTFIDNISKAEVARFGPLIENHSDFPARTNVEFAEVTSRSSLNLRVWERGAGETSACGTGAAAAVAASSRIGLTDRIVQVSLPGGDLAVEWAANGRVFITGDAQLVFTGTVGNVT